jgi:hypothetical protein
MTVAVAGNKLTNRRSDAVANALARASNPLPKLMAERMKAALSK